VGLICRDVFVPSSLVHSDGFTVEVGDHVHLALEFYCRYRTAATRHEGAVAVAARPEAHSHSDLRSVYEVVGVAVPTETVWFSGWILEAAGLLMYVTEAPDAHDPEMSGLNVYRESGSDPEIPRPDPGSWIRARGQLSIAEDHVTSGFEPRETLLRQAQRSWRVRRIVRLGNDYYRDVQAVDRADWDTTGFLLDLEDISGPTFDQTPA
jgi:hypothetical protein